MKRLVSIFVTASLLASTGCSTINTSQLTSPFRATTAADFEAKIDVGEKISGTASEWCILYFLCYGLDKFADNVNFNGPNQNIIAALTSMYGNRIQSAAAYDAVSKSNADVIIVPRYTVETKNYWLFDKTTATVTGFKGTIKSVSQVALKN